MSQHNSSATEQPDGQIDTRPASVAESKMVESTDSFTFRRVATFRSPFATCFGTPRQGLACPATRGRIDLSPDLAPSHLQGLECFSYVWVMFVFDRSSTDFASSGLVRPPRLSTKSHQKTGVFATRAPHRPNNIGFTVMKLDCVVGRSVYVSGVDVVDGTAVLDIKPYHPLDLGPYASLVSDQQDRNLGGCKLAENVVGGEVAEELVLGGGGEVAEELVLADDSEVTGGGGDEEHMAREESPHDVPEGLRDMVVQPLPAGAHFPAWCLAKQQQAAVVWTPEAETQLAEACMVTNGFYPDARDPGFSVFRATDGVSMTKSKRQLKSERFKAQKVAPLGAGAAGVDEDTTTKLIPREALFQLKKAISEVVSLDIRSRQHRRNQKQRTVWAFYYANLNVLFTERGSDAFEIFAVELCHGGPQGGTSTPSCWRSMAELEVAGGTYGEADAVSDFGAERNGCGGT